MKLQQALACWEHCLDGLNQETLIDCARTLGVEVKRLQAVFQSLCDVWEPVDAYVRARPEVKLGESIAGRTLEMLRERDALAAELAKLREQGPVGWADSRQVHTGTSFKVMWSERCWESGYSLPVYAAPVAAPATECRGIPGRGCQYLAACNMPCNKCGNVHNPLSLKFPAAPAVSGELVEAGGWAPAIVTTPFIPDADTRRNDAEFAAQQAATALSVPDGDDFNGTTPHLIQCMEALVRLDADGVLVPHGIGRDASKLLSAAANRLQQQAAPSVPEEWREFVKRTAEVGLHATNSGVECTCYRCVAIRGARALLQPLKPIRSENHGH